MKHRRSSVAALCSRFSLPPAASRQLSSLVDLVVHDPAAPTTVREPAAVLDDHLADSLIALDLPAVREAPWITDLGSGPGFPGLPLAIALPDAAVFLVESNGRKCAFLRHASEVCGVSNTTVVQARAEEWESGRGLSDVVVARALASLPVVAEYSAPLLRLGGALVAWRGRRDAEEETAAARAAAELGLTVGDPLAVAPYPDALHRHLHVMVKATATPERFPRRPGVARKRPLGAAPSDRAQR